MKELEMKVEELRKEIENIELTKQNILDEIQYCKDNDKDYLSFELILDKVKNSKRIVEEEINTLNNAMDILEGVK